MNVVQMKPNTEKFDEFWKEYPKKAEKAKTRVLFKRITSGGMKATTLLKDSGTMIELFLEATPDDLIKAAKAYYNSMRKPVGYGFVDDGKYLLNPTTFLNSGRFEDYL